MEHTSQAACAQMMSFGAKTNRVSLCPLKLQPRMGELRLSTKSMPLCQWQSLVVFAQERLEGASYERKGCPCTVGGAGLIAACVDVKTASPTKTPILVRTAASHALTMGFHSPRCPKDVKSEAATKSKKVMIRLSSTSPKVLHMAFASSWITRVKAPAKDKMMITLSLGKEA